MSLPGNWPSIGRIIAASVMAALLVMGNTMHLFAGPAATVRINLPPALPEPQALLPIAPDAARVANAEVPIDSTALAAAAPFRFTGTAEGLSRAVDCLAAAAWYEAGDDLPGERAVMQTVLNRARHPAFPATVCGVVFQGSERPTGCQFTFTCDGALTRTPSVAAWARARALGAAALTGQVDASVGTATHYHADYVVPYWQSSLVKIAQVGAHLFYRWPGNWGMPPAFHQHSTSDEPMIAALARLSPAHAAQMAGAADTLPALTQSSAPDSEPAIQQLTAHYAIGRADTGGAAAMATLSGDAFLILLEPDAFPGSYATRALGLCAGRNHCTVLGWRDPALHATALPLKPAARSGLTFAYVRDATNGAEGTYWNCAQIPRGNTAQCLPQGAAFDRLLARVQALQGMADACA
jgi:spore germination cell wall hydrolase CwlJ-like protein